MLRSDGDSTLQALPRLHSTPQSRRKSAGTRLAASLDPTIGLLMWLTYLPLGSSQAVVQYAGIQDNDLLYFSYTNQASSPLSGDRLFGSAAHCA